MTRINIQIKPLIVVMIALVVILIGMIISNYNMPQSLADKGNTNSSDKQLRQQQDFTGCLNKSMDKIMRGYLNFSDPDPISHCFDQFLKNNTNKGNGTNNDGVNNDKNGGNNDNNSDNNSSFSNV
jgi:hypothetical protein